MKQQFFMVQSGIVNIGDMQIFDPKVYAQLKDLNELIEKGWKPEKTYSCDKGYLVLLALAEESDQEALEKKPGEYEDVTSQIIVPTEEVDAKLADGYRLIDKDHIWAKTTALIKRNTLVWGSNPAPVESNEEK